MSMIDEDFLRDAMRQAAGEFEISRTATDRILDEARSRTTTARSWRPPAFMARQSRGRLSLAAAALVLVVGALSIPLVLSEGGGARFQAIAHVPASTEKKISGSGYSSSDLVPYSDIVGEQGKTTLSVRGTATSATGAAAANSASDLSPKIESNGTVDVSVAKGKINASLSTLGTLATKDGGYVFSTQANASASGSSAFSSATEVLQVPQRAFATLVTQVQRVGRATFVNTSSANVTGQYVNLQARIGALQASRQQYLAIMKRATSISGILAVQSQINTLQSQIEQYQGQLNVLSHETTYATLTVMLSETGHTSHPAHHVSGLRKAWNDSVGGFVAGFEWVIRLAGPVLFTLLLLAVLLGLGRLGWRTARRRRF
jgi:hypothetical protein